MFPDQTSSRADINEAPSWAKPWVIGIFLIAVVIVKLLVAHATELARDEAYYTLWALYPLQGGYFDHPPGVAWFIRFGQLLLGETPLASRLAAILATLVTGAATYRTANALFSSRSIAGFSVLWFTTTLGAAVGLFVITPDAPSMMFWALALWSAAELHRSGNANWWLLFGAFAGLGLASKYTGFFLGAGILVWLVAYRDTRKWFRTWQLYAGGLLALGIFSPVIAWNLHHGMSSLEFQFGRAASAFPEGLRGLRHIPEFIGSQFALLLPGLFIMTAVAFWLSFRKPGLRDNPALGLLTLTALPAMAYFLVHATHSRVEGNWPLPLYGQLAILGAWAAMRWSPEGRAGAWLARTIRILQFPVALLLVGALYVHAVTGFATVSLPRDPTREMSGWTETVAKVNELATQNGADVVFSTEYGMMGWLSSYAAFDHYTWRVLPLTDFRRFSFIPLPAEADLKWPALLAVKRLPGSPAPKTLGETLPVEGTLLKSITRDGPDGTPEDRIDVYLVPRPSNPVFTAE